MSRVFKLTVFCCCIAGLTAAAFGHPTEPRMFWVGPDGDPTNYPSDTTIVWAKAGDIVHTELWYQGPDGTVFQSNAVQAFFDTTLLPSSGCVQSGNVTAICASAAIDAGHPDFAGFGSQTVSVPPAQCPAVKAGFVLLNLSPPFEEDIPGNPDGAYFGGIDWEVSGDACGDFVSYYVGTPNLETIIIDHLNHLSDERSVRRCDRGGRRHGGCPWRNPARQPVRLSARADAELRRGAWTGCVLQCYGQLQG